MKITLTEFVLTHYSGRIEVPIAFRLEQRSLFARRISLDPMSICGLAQSAYLTVNVK